MHLLSLVVTLSQLVLLAQCLQNVTLDDNDRQIQYTGDWGRSTSTDLDYGGSHVLTTNTTAQAVFQFTGVAVYFMSPLWPYAVSTALTLDSRPMVIVDLTDHNSSDSGGGIETVASSVVWSAENLENTTHTLRISVGRGQQFAVVDGIIYTVLETGDSATGNSSSDDDSDGGDHDHQVLIIVLGTLLGVLVLVVLGLILWLCLRRRGPSASRTRRTSVESSGKWGGDAHDGASIAGHSPIASPHSSPHSPSLAPRSPPPPSRPDSNYHPGETAWSTLSVGGPGVPNMTGVGASARNSHAISYHHGDPTRSTSHFAASQGDLADAYVQGSYTVPNRDPRYPDI